MIDRFDTWRYSENSNCWDYVAEYLRERKGIDLERFGIAPSDKRAMTKASAKFLPHFTEGYPVDGAIACQYSGNVLLHVGVVEGDTVRHTGKECGTMREKIRDFERRAITTKYMIHKSLCTI